MMKKRSLLTSVVASTVLAGVLMLSGCGGSNTSKNNLASLGKNDPKAEGSADIIAKDSNGNLNSTINLMSGDKQVAQITLKKISKNDGSSCCTQASDGCKVEAIQISACGIKTDDAAFTAAKSHVVDLINLVGNRFNDKKSMIVFGGTLGVLATGFDNATMALSINMIKCGAAFNKDGSSQQSGFISMGVEHSVDVYVEDNNGVGKWIHNVKAKGGKILLTAADLGGLALPATFSFYTIYGGEAKSGTTGITGGTGGY